MILAKKKCNYILLLCYSTDRLLNVLKCLCIELKFGNPIFFGKMRYTA